MSKSSQWEQKNRVKDKHSKGLEFCKLSRKKCQCRKKIILKQLVAIKLS